MKRSPDGAIRRGFLLRFDLPKSISTTYQLLRSNQGLNTMTTLERRRLVKAQVIDVKVAKAAVNASRRQRAEAVKVLRKDMAAQRFNQLRAAG
jgi:hypothetical protein